MHIILDWRSIDVSTLGVHLQIKMLFLTQITVVKLRQYERWGPWAHSKKKIHINVDATTNINVDRCNDKQQRRMTLF